MKASKGNCPFKPGSRIWGYGRDSGGEEQQESVPSQKRRIEDYCGQHSLLLAHFFADEARVGSTTVGRDGLEDLLYLARQEPRPVEGIVFWSFSRLARNQLDAQFMRADLRRRGYIVHSMMDDIPLGEFAPVVEALIDWKNERFLTDLSRDVKRGLHDLAQQGYAPGGFPPRGYLAKQVQVGAKRDGRPHMVTLWVPDPDIAPRVRQAFAMRAAGASFQEIHEATQVLGTHGSYVTMFRNRTYLGIRKCGDTEVEGAHEPLVDRETWEAVQAKRRPRAKPGEDWPDDKPHPRRARTGYILSGLAFCAECGAAMVSGTDNVNGHRKTPWRFYLCSRKKNEGWSACSSGKIGAEGPEQAVLRLANERVLTAEFVTSLVAEVNRQLEQDTPSTVETRLKEKQRQLADAEKAISGLLDLVEKYGAESAGPRLMEKEAEKARLLVEVRQLDLQKQTQLITVSPEEVEGLLEEMRATLASEDIHAKRVLLSKIIVRMEMGPTGGAIDYTFPVLELTGIWRVPPREFESLSPP